MFTNPGTIIKHATIPNAITFQSAGYVSISNELYEDSKVVFSFSKPTEKMVLIPKYLSDGNFLFASLDKENQLHIGGIVKDSEKIYGVVDAKDNILDSNTLTISSNGSHFTVTLNNKTVFKFESALFVNGQVRVYGEAGEIFYSCEIQEPQSTAWASNADNGGVEVKTIKIEDHDYVKLLGSTSKKATFSQSISLLAKNHTLSFNAQGNGECLIKSGDTVLKQIAISKGELSYISQTFNVATPQTITLLFQTNEILIVGKHQLEDRVDPTPYIPNSSITSSVVRKGSSLKFPVKNLFDKRAGSIYLKLTTKNRIDRDQTIFRSDTNELSLAVRGTNLSYTVGASSITIPKILEGSTSYEFLCSWNDEGIELTINGENAKALNTGLLLTTPQELIFASEEAPIQEEVILEEWSLFNNKLPATSDIKTQLPFAVMQSLFDGGISGQNVTWSEIPVAPIDHSPILVQKEDGDTLQKVSFFNHETGAYQTWNQEPFRYDGKSDYVEVAYNNLDEQFRDIAIRTEDGEKIGEPYRIDGKRFYFSIHTNRKAVLKNKTLYATYQVNDTYTIDYNIKAVDGYRIDFAKHDGGKRIVYQEGNRYGEPKKLATMIDMNPIQNQNHEGFLYITNTINKTDSFRITATPDRLHADGASFSTLIIEPLDYQGNFLSHSNLEIIASKGFVSRHVSRDAVEAQKRSGQYLYQYHAPYIQAKRAGEIEEDYIWITDKDNNIGVCYKMLLSPVSKPDKVQLTQREKNLLTAKTKIINYLLMYEGVERYEDEVLFSILDFNQDGRVTMDEILVLETNQKDNELTVILNKLKEWEDTNHAATTS
ncbi:hypothetical protein COK00_12285 [Bacillus cereus]|uniref:hypothetical protein n=1 Tax=Bacillus cereus TaxID=1396 RepID=UPI000BF6D7EA|nr:hypothetical protein [Bacillus cereus]PFP65367.1 hypothetical protein COK00_12285 [Bacillus cereus]